MRQLGQMMLEKFAGKVIHPIAAVPGGFSKPMSDSQRKELIENTKTLLDFATFSMAHAKENIFPAYMDDITTLGSIITGFIGTLDDHGTLNFYDGNIRLMMIDGSFQDFNDADYLDYIAEHVKPTILWQISLCKVLGAKDSLWIFTIPKVSTGHNCLERLNACDYISTPLTQAELETFREQFERPAQHTALPLGYAYRAGICL